MSQKFKFLIIAILAWIPVMALPSEAFGETVLRVSDSVNIAADEMVENDFYAAGGQVSVSGGVAGDMYASGGRIVINGNISEDLSLLTGSAQIHGPVDDDVRVVGGDIVISDKVGGDVFVIGGSLQILSSAEVTGDVFFYGGEAEISGTVNGSVMGTAERIRVDSNIAGDIDVSTAGGLVLGDNAAVGGNVTYDSFRKLTRAQNASVSGDIIRNERNTEADTNGQSWIMFMLLHIFTILVVFYFGSKWLRDFQNIWHQEPAKSAVLGFISLLLTPVLAIFLTLTVLGVFIGGVLLISYILLLLISYILMPVLVSSALMKLITKQTELTVLWLTLGTLALYLVGSLPYIGGVAVLSVFIMTIGSLLVSLYNLFKK